MEITNLNPQYVRISEACKITGRGKSKVYQLMREGKIKYSEIRDKGALRGIRLISYSSLILYIESQTVEPCTNAEVETSNSKLT